jgi:hypothetical protein
MTDPSPNSQRRFIFRFGLVLLVFTSLCVLLAAFSPQPSAAAVMLTDPPTETAGPSPTPNVPPGCGGFKVSVQFRGFSDGKPIFSVKVTDLRDFDCDGIPDSYDNCRYTPNPDQAKPSDDVTWGVACIPESGFRLTGRASEVVIYQMDDGWLHLYSPEGEKLGELSKAGLIHINPSLTVQQVVGRTYVVGYTNAAGQFRSTRFQSNALTFTATDIDLVAVGPTEVQARPGQTVQFYARGYDRTGIELWFIPRWSATGGSITRTGLYTAGSVPGTYTVSACRLVTLCGTTTVTITN